MDELVGNEKHDNSRYCLANPGELYLVYLPHGEQTQLDLSEAEGQFAQSRLNPRTGEVSSKPTSRRWRKQSRHFRAQQRRRRLAGRSETYLIPVRGGSVLLPLVSSDPPIIRLSLFV